MRLISGFWIREKNVKISKTVALYFHPGTWVERYLIVIFTIEISVYPFFDGLIEPIGINRKPYPSRLLVYMGIP